MYPPSLPTCVPTAVTLSDTAATPVNGMFPVPRTRKVSGSPPLAPLPILVVPTPPVLLRVSATRAGVTAVNALLAATVIVTFFVIEPEEFEAWITNE